MTRHALLAAALLTAPTLTAAQTTMPTTAPAELEASADAVTLPPIDFQTQTLANGLRVIYAPMDNAPVVHVRVIYHVGSRDETPDRRGFAHMFEHMMFRGSAHVAAEEHMNLINATGGDSNAFTSFDQTAYVNTVPSNHLEMALYLEADRMASFVVTPEIFDTERNVVAEEWRLRTANPPYGTLFQDFFDLAYDAHHYSWTPIGDMEQLAQATAEELNAFHDKYYEPDNATLVVAGDFDVDQAREWVERYFGWIESEPGELDRPSPPEPEQAQMKERVVHKDNIPLARLLFGWKTADYDSEDQYALTVLGTILGDGRSSRLYRALVGGDEPLANVAQAGNEQLQDTGLFIAIVGVLPDADPERAKEVTLGTVERIRAEGVTEEELAKAKTQYKLALINARNTASSVAGSLGEEAVFGGDPERVNEAGPAVDALTVEDIQRVAQKYLTEDRLSLVQYRPGQEPQEGAQVPGGGPTQTVQAEIPEPQDPTTRAATEVETVEAVDEAMVRGRDEDATADPATRPAGGAEDHGAGSDVMFPGDYPSEPPFNTDALSADFEKGTTFEVDGVKVITLPDGRLPTVTMNLVLPTGGHAAPADLAGVADLTAGMLSRGAGAMTAEQLNEALDSRGISVNVGDEGDTTRVSVRTTADQFPQAVELVHTMLTEPSFPEDEFAKLKNQALSGLKQQLVNPGSVAGRELTGRLYGDSPLGRQSTPDSLSAVALADVKDWYAQAYKPAEGTFAVFAGDLTEADARRYADALLDGWEGGEVPRAEYDLPAQADQRRIVIVDNPAAQQATVRIAGRAYDNASDAKYAGSVASQILSNGIDSRMNRLLRAEKGLTYGAYAYFRPSRQDGRFDVSVDTKPESAAEAVESSFQVLNAMRDGEVTEKELETAQQIVSGAMVMSTQTIDQQAGRRVTIEVNGYPADYYDTLPQKVNQVTKTDVQAVMKEYVDPATMTLVVVGPAETLRPQLDPLGDVTVVPMPLQR